MENLARYLDGLAICSQLIDESNETKSVQGGRPLALLAWVVSTPDELRARVKQFATRVLKFLKTLPRDAVTDGVVRQLARSAPSVSANYHSTRRARTRREYVARMGVVADEADESEGWLKLLKESQIASGPEFEWLLNEGTELRGIFVQSFKTARLNYLKSQKHRPDPKIPRS